MSFRFLLAEYCMSFLHQNTSEEDLVAVVFESDGFRDTIVHADFKSSTEDGASRWFVQTSLSDSDHRFRIIRLNRDGLITSEVNEPEFLEKNIGFLLHEGINVVNCLQAQHYWNHQVRFTAAVRNLTYHKKLRFITALITGQLRIDSH